MSSVGRQIRAARGLLKWSGAVLAEKVHLTRDAISKIEDEAVEPRSGTLADIIRVFDENGIEFTDNFGVRCKPQGVEVLIGEQGLQRFFDNVYEYAKKHGGTIMQLGIEEDLFWAMGVEFSEAHRKRMAELVKERKDIKVLAILCEGDTNFIASDYNQYRWISKDLFSPVPFYIYGEYLAIMNFQTQPGPTIVLHKMPAIANSYRKQFEAFWKMSREPDVQSQSIKQTSRSKGKNK
ncbi:MAG: helix-turn-helix transcriptional regulator [Patescibacteria group bacterium]|nr:helix-turn-helix transcriptional regulator [Patescibacteria group bacterium]